MARGDPAEIAGSNRQLARERAFRLLAISVSALFLTFVALGGAFVWYDRAASWVSHTHEVRSGIDSLRQALTDAESAQRGFILTGDSRFTDQVEAARAAAQEDAARLTKLTQDNPLQHQRVQTLRGFMATRMAAIDETIAARSAGSVGAALQIIARGEGIAAMDGVRRIAGELEREEARLQVARTQQVAIVRSVIITALVFFGLLLSFLFTKAMRDINLDREVEADTSERLRALLADRTLLLDEVNHRVKNSLQQIASVVRLQSRSVASPETRAALDTTLDRIIAVGRVHEQLYKAGGQIGVFDAGHYAKSLAHDLVDSMGREDIVLETDIRAAMLDLRQAAPLALILNELITNALKYGCPPDRPGKIKVSFGTEGEEYRLGVSDEGEGLPEGFTIRGAKSLGMRAIEALSRQLGGRFEIEQPGTGAAFAVLFPRST